MRNSVRSVKGSLFLIPVILFFSFCKRDKITPPVITTLQITDITQFKANSGGNIAFNGGSEILSRGVCWSTSANPAVSDKKTTDGTGDGRFSSEMKDLSSNTKYFVRAYASNEAGTGYGNILSFITKKIELPAVLTLNISGVTQSSAVSGGEITEDNGGTITGRGVCWSTSPVPTLEDSKTSDGNGIGRFVSSLSGLIKGTTYYLRAYGTNSAGVAYGNEIIFRTVSTSPEITTATITSIGTRSANSGGTILSDGGEPVTEKGICWNNAPNPTLENFRKSEGSGSDNYKSLMTDLNPGTCYNVRAYAINKSGTAYGNNLSFSTLPEPPVLFTSSAASVTSDGVVTGGTITSDGGSTVILRGVCWSTTHNPTLADEKTSNGSGTGSFSSKITGLKSGTLYYIRAFAINSAGTSYGNEISFRTTRRQIIADHTVVIDFNKIPAEYLARVKKMMVSFMGESHAVAYRTGMTLLNGQYPEFACNVGTGEGFTDRYLRVDYSGWLGEEEWFTWLAYPFDSQPAEKNIIKDLIKKYSDEGHPIDVMGFAWCWDHTNGGTSNQKDPVYGVSWYGFSVNGPDGNNGWGLDADDYIITGNRVSMQTYFNATIGYINFCKAENIPTTVVFTSCPVDNNDSEGLYSGERGYQGHLKQEYIRNFVKTDTSRILFDYADILCYDDDGKQTTTSWNGHTYPCITTANLGDAGIGHISSAGAIRLAKAQWWLLARIAGWNGE